MCMVCAACALRDWAKGGLLHWPSGGAMRCSQSSSGGVLDMTKGTALFDTVAISGTEATVRIGVGPDAQLGRVSAVGAGCRRTGCAGRLQ